MSSLESPAGAHRTLSPGLTMSLRGFLYAAAALAIATAAAVYSELGRFVEWWEFRTPAAEARLVAAEAGRMQVESLLGLATIVIGILTITWWYQAYLAVQRVEVAGRAWSPGWAIGGWFIPIANYVIPKLVLNEIDRVSAAAEEGAGSGDSAWRRRRLLGTANWWWAAWVAANVLSSVSLVLMIGQVGPDAVIDGEAYAQALRLRVAGSAAMAAAALLGAASLRVFGSRLTR